MKRELDSKRFQEEYKYIHEFADKFLIACPKCSRQAEVVLAENIDFSPSNHLFLSRKLICSNCGYNKREESPKGIAQTLFSTRKDISSYVVIGGNFDWYFQESLWLQTECCSETLWFYNKTHLEFIENYVEAKLRERTPNENSSLASRLPKWIKSAKNREEILKAIGKLKDKLNE